jgi:2-deoxy-D-gluconate 3-dehydrogenase
VTSILAGIDPGELMSLRDRVALVTGAGTGLGQAITAGLAAAGADVILLSERHNMDESEAIVREYGRKSRQVVVDLGDLDLLPAALTRHIADGPVDILVNCAGVIRREDACELSDANWHHVLNVNLNAAFLLTRHVGQTMVRRRTGKIVNIASMLSFQGGVRVASYAASKHALVGLTRALANEWAPHNVQVNAIAPGYFATEVTAALRADANLDREIVHRIPASRWGQPIDIVGAAIFLAAAASDYVNGHVLAVDGGWLSR